MAYFKLIFIMCILHTSRSNPNPTPSTLARTPRESRTSSYSYAYAVDAPEHRNFYDHKENRDGDVTQGRFRVALPDNRLQTVTYRAGVKGYLAKISYARHPDFQSLRSAVGPIRQGPTTIGQSVVSQNWKNGERHHEHGGPNAIRGSTPIGTPTPTVRPKVTSPSRPRPTTPVTRRPRPTTPVTRRPRPSPKPRLTTTGRPRFAFATTSRTTQKPSRPQAQRLVSRPSTTRGTSPRPRLTTTALLPSIRPPPHMPDNASLFVSTEGLDDPEILKRLIEAIRRKVESEEALNGPQHHDDDDDDSSHEKEKPRYSISDRTDVANRLQAIVHRVPIHKI